MKPASERPVEQIATARTRTGAAAPQKHIAASQAVREFELTEAARVFPFPVIRLRPPRLVPEHRTGFRAEVLSARPCLRHSSAGPAADLAAAPQESRPTPAK